MMKQIIFLFCVLVLVTSLPIFFSVKNVGTEGYSAINLEQSSDLLVRDIYPPIGKNEISSNSSSNYSPYVELGSYAQTTNNNKYPINPDTQESCTPASMCNVLYKDIHGKEIQTLLPPVSENGGVRVGYFDAK
jgi:hypothetical protein